jgi:hypothetical protein
MDPGPVRGIDVHTTQVTLHMGQRKEARVHHTEPQGRQIRQREHPEVAAGQLRQLLEVAQRLVAPRRVRMVV